MLVRHFDAPRIPNWLRITIGTPDDMTALLRGHLRLSRKEKGRTL